MAGGHGWGGASRAGSNHPALASASAAPPYPRRGALSRIYVAVYNRLRGSHESQRCKNLVRTLDVMREQGSSSSRAVGKVMDPTEKTAPPLGNSQ
jgi:hypothetical protein